MKIIEVKLRATATLEVPEGSTARERAEILLQELKPLEAVLRLDTFSFDSFEVKDVNS